VFGEPWQVLGQAWDALAVRDPSPFTTSAWLSSWWAAFGHGEPMAVTRYHPDGRLAAGAVLRRGRLGTVRTPANVHSGDWAPVAADAGAAAAIWAELAALSSAAVALGPLRPADAATARAALEAAGRRVRLQRGPGSPHVVLPASFDELLAGRSRNLRSQVGRRRRALQRHGVLRLRTTTGGPRLERDLAAVLRVEASGWKGRAGTAILLDERTDRLYRGFARLAAQQGWLRLHLLELDGSAIAADLGCVIAGRAFLLKTGYDETFARCSPGLVLRAEVLRALIDEGVAEYDLLGEADPYKLRWTATVRPRVVVHGFKGAAAVPPELYVGAARPALRRLRHRVQEARR